MSLVGLWLSALIQAVLRGSDAHRRGAFLLATPSTNELPGPAAARAHCSLPKPSPRVLSPSFPRRPQCKRGVLLSSQPCQGDGVSAPQPQWAEGREGTLEGPTSISISVLQLGPGSVTEHLARSGLLCSLPFVAFSKVHLQCSLWQGSVYIPYLYR